MTLTMLTGAVDGAEVVAALLCLNIFHPGFLRIFLEKGQDPQLVRLVDRLQVPTAPTPQRWSAQPEEESPPLYDDSEPLAVVADEKVDFGKAV